MNCFIITPIDTEGSVARRATDGLIAMICKPILSDMGCTVAAAHELSAPGSITNHIIDHLLNDELVVCNLTGLNPNVMYELAVRHAVRRPVVIIAEHGTKLPFDVIDQRTIFFTNDIAGCAELGPKLRSACESALKENLPDNPIYRSGTDAVIRKLATSNDTLKYILDHLAGIHIGVNELERRLPISEGPQTSKKDEKIEAMKAKTKRLTEEFIALCDYEAFISLNGIDSNEFTDQLRKRLPPKPKDLPWILPNTMALWRSSTDVMRIAICSVAEEGQLHTIVANLGGTLLDLRKNPPVKERMMMFQKGQAKE